jgi:hypothetical protein
MLLGRKMSREAIEKTRAFNLGSKRSEETKRKMSEFHKKRWENIRLRKVGS